MLLTACGSKWQVEVDLTPEQRQAIEASIKELKKSLKNVEDPTEASSQEIIDLARAYQQLGDMKSAIDLYESYIKKGRVRQVMLHNLGRLYEEVKEYDLAVEQYQHIIDKYFDNNYLYDITRAYIRAEERKKAEKYFNAWQLEFHTTDEQIQQLIKRLRAKEKAAEMPSLEVELDYNPE